MRLLWTLLVVAVALIGVQALSEGEKTALRLFAHDWPGLELQEPPWTSNYSAACDPPSWFGLSCSIIDGEAHVTELYAKLDIASVTHVFLLFIAAGYL